MLDFTELSTDGSKFEQLIRELLLKAGLRPSWTGVGADSGRDLIAEEEIIGPLTRARALWLVDCKHYARSGKSVGVGDVVDIFDRCARISASGFLLVTSTQPSAELMRKLDEIKKSERLSVTVWDAVDIEKRLLTHENYYLAQQFFSSPGTQDWKIFYTEREQRWTAHYRGNFLYVESRSGIDPPSLPFLQRIIHELSRVKVSVGECLRVRAIWHDTPNGCFYNCWADYLVPANTVPSLNKFEVERALRDNIDGQVINWEMNLQLTLPSSDYHDEDDHQYYSRFKEPLYHAVYKVNASTASEENPHWWRVNPPIIRNFNDALMWGKVKSIHGYHDGMVTSPPYR
ncbi:Restriction endonuclease [Sphingomonas sp. NFR15]|nr:Restriction endonuclease [Sphingomonas sp. NFR15]